LRSETQKEFGVPKYDICAGFDYAMLRNGRDQGMADRDGIDEETPPGMALVPLAWPIRLARTSQITRPDPTFVAHLIATAARVPQTCNLRRGAPSDAHSAYTASLRPATGASCRTRQVV
jgi:hypothetical protein